MPTPTSPLPGFLSSSLIAHLRAAQLSTCPITRRTHYRHANEAARRLADETGTPLHQIRAAARELTARDGF